jgi:hypothetical protein
MKLISALLAAMVFYLMACQSPTDPVYINKTGAIATQASKAVIDQGFYKFTSITGNNATMAIITSPLTVTRLKQYAKFNNLPLVDGDEIGVFTPDSLCVGATLWNGVNTALTVWGDNDMTSKVDGIRPNELMSFRIYSHQFEIEYPVQVTLDTAYAYLQKDLRYKPDGLYVTSSLKRLSINDNSK